MSTEPNVEIMSTSNEVIPNEVMSDTEQLTKKQLKRIEYEKKVSDNIIKNNIKVAACINEIAEKFFSFEDDSASRISRWKGEKFQALLIEAIQENKLKSKLKSTDEIQHNIEKNTKKQERQNKKKQKTQERIEKMKQKRIEKNLSKSKKNLSPGTVPGVSKYDKNKVNKTPPQIEKKITPTTPFVQHYELSQNARPFLVRTNTEPRFKKYV